MSENVDLKGFTAHDRANVAGRSAVFAAQAGNGTGPCRDRPCVCMASHRAVPGRPVPSDWIGNLLCRPPNPLWPAPIEWSGFDLRHGRLCGAAIDADPANARFAFVHAIALRCRRRIRPMSISLRLSFRRPCNAWTCREPPISHGIPPPCAPAIRASQRSSAVCPDDEVSRPSTSGGRVFPCGARRESPQAARMTFIAFSRAALPKTS